MGLEEVFNRMTSLVRRREPATTSPKAEPAINPEFLERGAKRLLVGMWTNENVLNSMGAADAAFRQERASFESVLADLSNDPETAVLGPRLQEIRAEGHQQLQYQHAVVSGMVQGSIAKVLNLVAEDRREIVELDALQIAQSQLTKRLGDPNISGHYQAAAREMLKNIDRRIKMLKADPELPPATLPGQG